MLFLVELAKVGVAGLGVLLIYLSYSLLKQREVAAARPVPTGHRMPKPPSTTPIYVHMGLGVLVAILLLVASLLESRKEDLSSEIADLRYLSQNLEKQRRLADDAARSIRVRLGPYARADTTDEIQRMFKDSGGELSSATSEAKVIAERLVSKSSRVPAPPNPLPPYVPAALPPAGLAAPLSPLCDFSSFSRELTELRKRVEESGALSGKVADAIDRGVLHNTPTAPAPPKGPGYAPPPIESVRSNARMVVADHVAFRGHLSRLERLLDGCSSLPR